MAQLAKMGSVCRILCGLQPPRVALLGKKDRQERLPSRISALLDTTLNDDNGLLNLRCAVCKRRVERLETAMMDEV